MNPIVDGLEESYKGKIEVRWLNVEEPTSEEAIMKYGVRVIPFFLLVDESGTPKAQWAGLVERSVFEETFDRLLQEVISSHSSISLRACP